MAQQIEEEGNGRDYFWVKIVVGLVLVTIASLLISKLVVPWASSALGGKNRPAVTEKGNTTVFEETGKMVQGVNNGNKNKPEKKAPEKTSQLTEEESAGEAPAAGETKTDVKIEKIEPEKTEAAPPETKKAAAKEETTKPENKEPVSNVTEKKAETKKEAPAKQAKSEKTAAEKAAAGKSAEKEPAKVAAKPKPAPESKETKETKPAVKEKPEVAAKTPAAQPKPAAEAKPAPKVNETKPPENNKNVVYVLQLGNFTSQENADRMKKILVDQYKLEVFIKKIQYEGQTRFRVQAGAFKDKANAQKLARELQIKGYNSYIASETAAGK